MLINPIDFCSAASVLAQRSHVSEAPIIGSQNRAGQVMGPKLRMNKNRAARNVLSSWRMLFRMVVDDSGVECYASNTRGRLIQDNLYCDVSSPCGCSLKCYANKCWFVASWFCAMWYWVLFFLLDEAYSPETDCNSAVNARTRDVLAPKNHF